MTPVLYPFHFVESWAIRGKMRDLSWILRRTLGWFLLLTFWRNLCMNYHFFATHVTKTLGKKTNLKWKFTMALCKCWVLIKDKNLKTSCLKTCYTWTSSYCNERFLNYWQLEKEMQDVNVILRHCLQLLSKGQKSLLILNFIQRGWC